MAMQQRPKIAIIDPNTLAVLGLKQILQNVLPIMNVETFGSMAEFMANHPERFFHYFVAMNIVLENRPFFTAHRRQTIVLTLSLEGGSQLRGFHSVCISGAMGCRAVSMVSGVPSSEFATAAICSS